MLKYLFSQESSLVTKGKKYWLYSRDHGNKLLSLPSVILGERDILCHLACTDKDTASVCWIEMSEKNCGIW